MANPSLIIPEISNTETTSRRGLMGMLLILTCCTWAAQTLNAATGQVPASERPPAVLEAFMQKLGAGVLAPHAGASAIPATLNTGPRYAIGGTVWEPTAVSDAAPTAYTGVPVEINADSEAMIVITNAPRTAGTNALLTGVVFSGSRANTEGDLWAFNRANYSAQAFTPSDETSWLVTVTNLVEGPNRIGIYGQDPLGAIAGDGVTVWVGERYTSVPAVGFTIPDFTVVSNAVTGVSLEFTNNVHVRGDAWWYNAKTWARGLAATGIVDEASWSVDVDDLDVGRNPIYILASNRYGDVALDLTTVIRRERLDAVQVIITNWPAVVVQAEPGYALLSGAHTNVQGSLGWQVPEQGTAGFFAPGPSNHWQTVVPVIPGTNTIRIYGRDAAGGFDRDEVTVRLGGEDLVNPAALTIINPNPTTLPYPVSAVTLSVITAMDQVQSLVWTNIDDGVGGPLITDPTTGQGYTATVSNLVVGPTYIDVLLVNSFGNRASELLTVVRQPRSDLPFIDVTGAPPDVPFPTTEVNIDGTNNEHVVGSVTWSNSANGVQGEIFREGPTWSGLVQPLAVGENVIYLFASNTWGDVRHDVASISRGANPLPPRVAITGTVPESVAYDVTAVSLVGVNNDAVSGIIQWENISVLRTGSVERTGSTTWTGEVPDLQPGMNTIYVSVSNLLGETDAAVASVYRATSRGDARIWISTNELPHEVDFTTEFVSLFGTNNEFVVGDMWWVNEAFGITGLLERAQDLWGTEYVPLPEGVSVIYVYGTNELGQRASDVVTIERLGPGGDPVVDVTSIPPESISHAMAAFPLEGTNSADVVGMLHWTNADTGVTGDLPVEPDGHWSFEASGLLHGNNNIFVSGTDAYGQEANDVVSIFRDFPPATRYVALWGGATPPYTNWVGAAHTIQQAVDAASEGDLILVAEGEYAAGSRVRAGEQTQTRLVVDKQVRVQSEAGPQNTVIYGAWDGALNAVRCARVSEGGELVGFTLKEGHAEPFLSLEDGIGGGVLVSGGIVSNCLAIGNTAGESGGGVAAEAGALVTDSVIAQNQAPTGGGISAVNATVEGCEIIDNEAGPGEESWGGGLVAFTNTTVANCVLAHNHATSVGGGVAALNGSRVEHCTLVENRADLAGGGIFSIALTELSHSILIGNTTPSGQDAQFGGQELIVQQCLLPAPDPAYPDNWVGIPVFKDPDSRDYRLLAGSPGIDLVPQSSQAHDLDGKPRPLDGDGDGQALADTGAFEFLNPLADTDQDRLPDGWEWEHGLSPVSALGRDGRSGNPDGDGLDNEGEHAADTDPFDAASVLAIRGLHIEGPVASVMVQGGIHADRALEAREVLGGTGTTWSVVDDSPSPTPVTNVLTHSGTGDRQFYYRVRARRNGLTE